MICPVCDHELDLVAEPFGDTYVCGDRTICGRMYIVMDDALLSKIARLEAKLRDEKEELKCP